MAPVIKKGIPHQVKLGAYFSKAVPGEPLVRASQRPGLPRRGGRDGGGEGSGRRLLGRPDPGFSRAQREEKGYDEDDSMITLGSSDSEDDDEEGGAWTQLGPREQLTPPPGEGRDVEEDEAIEAMSPSPAKRRRLVSRAQLPSSESTSTSEVGDIVPAKRHHTRSQAYKKWERRDIKAVGKTLDISIPLGAEWPRDTEEEEEEEKSDEKSDDEVKEKTAAPSAATTIDTRTTRSSAPLTSASPRARIIRSRRITTSANADGSRSTRSTRQATKDVSSSPPPKRSARRTALRTPCKRGPVSNEEEESDGTPDPLRMSSLTPPSKKARIATNHFAVAAEDSDSSDMLEIGVRVGSSSAAKTARSSARNMASCSTSKMRKSKDHASRTRQEQSVSPLPVRCQVRKTHGWKQVVDSDEEMAKDEIEKDDDDDDDDDDDELVMAPQRRRLRRIPDPDDKEGSDDDDDDPPRQSRVLNNNKKQRDETKNEEKDEEEEPDDLEDDQGRLYTLDTRMRGADQRIGKAAAGRKNMLAILKKKREGRSSPTFHVIDSEADEEDMEDDDENLSRASEDDNDEEDAMIVDDDDNEEDEFIVEDYQADRFQLPSQFQQVRPMRSNFDIAVQYHIHLIVFGPSFALQHGKAPYFSAALNRIRDQIIDVRNSKITSQIWPTHFKVALERYPTWDGYRIEDLPPCDACRISGRPATWEVVLSGDPYDRKTFQVIVPSNDGEGSEGADAKFNCGRFCYARAEFQHQMNHWEYDLHESLRREISKLPSTADKQSYSDAGREFMLEGGIEVPARDECTEEAVDQILAYFQLKAISDREWRKVKRLLEEGDSLNSQWSRRQGDV